MNIKNRFREQAFLSMKQTPSFSVASVSITISNRTHSFHKVQPPVTATTTKYIHRGETVKGFPLPCRSP